MTKQYSRKKRSNRRSKRGGGDDSVIPPAQSYGYPAGASSPMEAARINQANQAKAQNELIQQHGGEIVVPQANDGGIASVGPNDGNSAATSGAVNLTQSNANAKYDNEVGQPGKSTTVAGGGKKRRKRKYTRRRKTNKRTRRRKNKKRKTRRRGKYGYRQIGCSKKTRTKSRRRFINGGKKMKRSSGQGGYAAQIWQCFS